MLNAPQRTYPELRITNCFPSLQIPSRLKSHLNRQVRIRFLLQVYRYLKVEGRFKGLAKSLM